MSVAALQRQLAATNAGEVSLRPYLAELCESIGASMIPDPVNLTLSLEADDGAASADASVSLGLIVTELVINALKYAFPEERGGHIIVSYRSRGPDWTLSVSDDGVGKPASPPVSTGLGTTIVQALAQRLRATVTVVDGQPGTSVTIAHAEPLHAALGA